MREIKFRVWDMYEKKFTRIFTLDKFNGIKVEHLNDLSWSRPYLVEEVFQQYTGLTDRNGQEIYEGDIFKDDYWWVGEATVEYANGMFGFEGGESGKLDFRPIIECEHIEIIGNIFEGVDK